jgi:hypothetical protein
LYKDIEVEVDVVTTKFLGFFIFGPLQGIKVSFDLYVINSFSCLPKYCNEGSFTMSSGRWQSYLVEVAFGLVKKLA